MMKFQFVAGLVVYLGLLLLCLLTTITMTMNKAFIQAYNAGLSVDLRGYQIKPDVSVGVHVLLLAVAMFVPSLTGLFYVCIKKESQKRFYKKRLRVVHVTFLLVGIVVMIVLLCSEAAAIGDINSVNCSLDYSNCKCLDADTSNNVCACRQLRISYFVFIALALCCEIISLLLTAKLIKCPPCGGASAVGQGPTENSTMASTVAPRATQGERSTSD
ncbi:uncharacterized protein [Haliotis cracherodii]|uniref:uncharacterized protein n=1 Tax=Haliotis cracherodii TaxID=6455 RepID=UPI0039EC94E8